MLAHLVLVNVCLIGQKSRVSKEVMIDISSLLSEIFMFSFDRVRIIINYYGLHNRRKHLHHQSLEYRLLNKFKVDAKAKKNYMCVSGFPIPARILSRP